MLGKEKIKSIIPQREPFLMIDEIEEYIPGESAICYKDVKEEEWYFKGHFPGNPIMPGVLITESLAQAGAIAILSKEENKGKNALFAVSIIPFKLCILPSDPGITGTPAFFIKSFAFDLFPINSITL